VSAEILSQCGHELPKQDINQLSTIAFSGAKRLHEDIEQILRYMDMTSALPLLDEGCQVGQIEKIVERICHQLYDSCHFDIPPDIQQLAVALPEATMEVILWELLDNSRKFHPQNQPALSIYVSCKSDNMLCIAVCDNGIHLSAEQLARAWTPYYQGDKYFTGQIKGMGLGLAMVASFVWSVGGNCHISNLIDQPGVSVELILPVKTTP
jgi:K+-sensing histidine kinase KdpD